MKLGGVYIFIVCLLAVVSVPGPPAARAMELSDAPGLTSLVEAGELPPVEQRMPMPPAVATLDGGADTRLGEYGGTLNLLMSRQKDIRLMMVYGYARLVGYDRDLNLVPDLAARIEVKDGRSFTFHLRKNHRWSDGQPFTAEDFRYYWEDVANNEILSPIGLPKVMIVDGEAPRFEVIDEWTVRYSWSNPNPDFLPRIAGARPLFIYRPAHYLKQFHARYADLTELQAKYEAASKRNWASLHHRRDHQYRFDNIGLPSLQPWINTTEIPSERFVFKRNPYYHRADSKGRQLPYIDEVIVNIADNSLIPAKTGFGESDLQGRYIRFDHYTFLKKGEQANNFKVRLWRRATGSNIALLPNLNVEDAVWRVLMRDVRFRRALSLAIDRQSINQVLYFGLARPSANTILPLSPLFKPEYQTAWAEYDIARANALLDAIGLTERDSNGTRLMSDGRPIEIIIESAGESTEESDALELVKSDWGEVGIELFTKPSQREVFRNRIFAGSAIMSVWSGLDNALPTANMSPAELAPTAQTQLQWPKWGQYYETGKTSGLPPDIPAAQELLRLNDDWRFAQNEAERTKIWHKMLKIHADQVFSIGTVNSVPQPVVINNALMNLPVEGVYSWNPSAYFGIYKPDTFWFADERRRVSQ